MFENPQLMQGYYQVLEFIYLYIWIPCWNNNRNVLDRINGQDSDKMAFLTDFTEIMKDVDILLKSLILINEDDPNKKRLFDD